MYKNLATDSEIKGWNIFKKSVESVAKEIRIKFIKIIF